MKNIQCPDIMDVPVLTVDDAICYERYVLRAVVLHAGASMNGGHYYSYVKSLDVGEGSCCWTLFNDSRVSVSPMFSLQNLIKKFPTDTPYVLFYTKAADEAVPYSCVPTPELLASIRQDNLRLAVEEGQVASHSRKPANISVYSGTKPNTMEPYSSARRKYDRGGGMGDGGGGGGGWIS